MNFKSEAHKSQWSKICVPVPPKKEITVFCLKYSTRQVIESPKTIEQSCIPKSIYRRKFKSKQNVHPNSIVNQMEYEETRLLIS